MDENYPYFYNREFDFRPTYINPKTEMETTVLKKIWLSPPHMGGNEEAYVKEAFDTNWIAPLGPNVQQFEKSIEGFVGNNTHAACLSSGTSAIHLGLELLGVSKGDEVICQSFTFSASANPITYLGASPIFVDSEEDTWNIHLNFWKKQLWTEWPVEKNQRPLWRYIYMECPIKWMRFMR